MYRILIVDEDELMTKTMVDILRHHDYEYELDIWTASSAEEARNFMENASLPVDLILADFKLQGSDVDGIELLGELKAKSSQVQTIVYTGYPSAALHPRIEEAGIDDYLPKPFTSNELSTRVHRLLRSRMAEDENVWLRQLANTSIAAHDFDSIHALAQTIVADAQTFGFQRVRFYRLLDLDTDDPVIVGVAQSGLDVSDFTDVTLALSKSEYVREVRERNEIRYFKPDDPRIGFLERGDLISDFKRPAGEWVGIPVESQGRCVAVLMMDHGDRPGRISTVQRKHLSLFVAQINTAYNRVLRQEMSQTREQIKDIADELKKQLQRNTGLESLQTFCKTFYTAVLTQTPKANLSVIIRHDEEWMCEWIRYDQGQLTYQDQWRSVHDATVIPFLLSEHRQSLFQPEGTAEFREDHELALHGREARSWMAALFSSGDQTGALVVEHDNRPNAFSRNDFDRLCALAEEIGGRIFTTWQDHLRRQLTERLALVQRASEDIMLLAAQSEDWLWHTTLTLATAHYGFSYDRALLLLKEPASEETDIALTGRMAIGHNCWPEAKEDWEHIAEKQRQIEKTWHEEGGEDNGSLSLKYWNVYLDQLRGDRGELNRSPLEQKLKETPLELRLAVDDDGDALVEVMARNRPLIIPDEERQERIPPEIYDFLYGGGWNSGYKKTDCIIVPVTAGPESLGALLIDNVWRKDPQQTEAVEYIDTLTNQAAVLYQNRQLSASRSQLDEFKYSLLNDVSHRTQKETLDQLSSEVMTYLKANHVAVYPLIKNGERFRYAKWKYAGDTGTLPGGESNDPNVSALDAMILEGREPRAIDEAEELELHPYAKRVGVKSMIVAPVLDAASNEVRAVMYVDYCSNEPRRFSAQMIEMVREFAVLAATALRYHRELSQRDREQERLRKVGASLARMMERCTGAALNEMEDVVTIVLEETAEAIGRNDVILSLVLRDWKRERPDASVYPVRHEYEYNRAVCQVKMTTVNEIGMGIRGHVLETGKQEHVPNLDAIAPVELRSRHFPIHPDTREALYLPISLESHKPMGVLVIESPRPHSFTDVEVEAWSGIATASALLFTHLRRQLWLQEILRVTGQITAPIELEETLEAIGKAIQRTTPGVDIVTIWYPKPDAPDTFICGLATGPIDEKHQGQERALDDLPYVVQALKASEPEYVESVNNPGKDSFVERNNIQAYSSLPIRIDERLTGVLFLSYTHFHTFPEDEKTIFPILASIIGAAINDALSLEKAQAERLRFECALNIVQAMGTTLEIDEIIAQIFTMLEKENYFPDATPAVLLYNEDRQALEFAPVSLASDRYNDIDDVSIPLDSQFVAAAAARNSIEKKKKTPWRRGDIRTCPKSYRPLYKNTRAHLSVPLYNTETEKLTGVFVLEREQENAFDENDEKLAMLIATDIRIGVERAMLREELEFNRTVAAAAAWATEAAHDVNSTTFRILSETDALLAGNLTKKQQDEVERIEKSIRQLSETVLPPHQQSVETINVRDSLLSWISEFTQGVHPPIRFVVEPESSSLEIETYPFALKHVIGQLVRNSKAAFKRGETRNPEIRMKVVLQHPDRIELIYEDSGPGIPHKLRPKILKEPINDPNRPNRGKGLLLARFRVEQMGGKMHFDPSYRKGVRFVIALSPTVSSRNGTVSSKQMEKVK